jgi:hypothetical protein
VDYHVVVAQVSEAMRRLLRLSSFMQRATQDMI